MAKARVAYDMGLLNGKEFLQARAYALYAALSALDGDYLTAREYRGLLEDYIASTSGVNLYDARLLSPYSFESEIQTWANTPQAKRALHLPLNATWKTSEEYEAAAGESLNEDLMVSYAKEVALILDHYRVPVLLYQGQFDVKDGPISNQAWIRNLKWSGQKGYLQANRTRWYLPEEDNEGREGAEKAPLQVGWVQRYDLLTEAVVAGAGHLVPMDQPVAALDMITRFIEGEAPFAPEAAPVVEENGLEGGEDGSGAVLLALNEGLEDAVRQEM